MTKAKKVPNAPPEKKKRDPIPYLLAVVALILAGIAWQKGGLGSAVAGTIAGGQLLWHELPLLVAAFLTAGLIQVLVSREMVERWLGSESGWRGLLLGRRLTLMDADLEKRITESASFCVHLRPTTGLFSDKREDTTR